MDNKDRSPVARGECKAWQTPQVRNIIPSKRTAGGMFNNNPNQQDDTWYTGS